MEIKHLMLWSLIVCYMLSYLEIPIHVSFIFKKKNAVISELSSACGSLLRAVFKVVVRGQICNIVGKVLLLSYVSGWRELCHT